MTLNKQLLVCAAALLVGRVTAQFIPLYPVSPEEAGSALIDQWAALLYFGLLHHFFFDRKTK